MARSKPFSEFVTLEYPKVSRVDGSPAPFSPCSSPPHPRTSSSAGHSSPPPAQHSKSPREVSSLESVWLRGVPKAHGQLSAYTPSPLSSWFAQLLRRANVELTPLFCVLWEQVLASEEAP